MLTFLVTVNIRSVTCLGIPQDANDDTAQKLTYLKKLNADIPWISTSSDDIRFKRVTTKAVKGIAAIRKLLEGSTQIAPTRMRQSWFEKTGDFRAALEDFFSVRPQNVKTFSGQVTDGKGHVAKGRKTLDGEVGDRRIILRSDGIEANPVLEVIDGNSSGGPHVDFIIYKKDR